MPFWLNGSRGFDTSMMLWRKLNVAKYYHPSCVWPTTARRSSKSPWSDCHTTNLVVSLTQHCLGTSDTISFRKDRWHDCGTLFVIFPHLFHLYCTPDIFVVEAWLADSKTWDLHFRHRFTDPKIQEWAFLSTILSNVRFCMVPNFWRWAMDSSSTFTIKSIMDDLTGALESFD